MLGFMLILILLAVFVLWATDDSDYFGHFSDEDKDDEYPDADAEDTNR